MSPEITAVVTTNARPAHVYQALASVCQETYRDIEVVVVDDGGTFVPPGDAARPIHVQRGSGAGVARARNLGLAVARGESIIFLDDDDVALPDRIVRLVTAARETNAALSFGMTRRVVEETGAVLEDVPTHAMPPGVVGFCDLLACAPHVNAVLVRTETLRAVGGFDTGADHFDDWSAWLRIADLGTTICRIPDTVAEWRLHEQGLSGQVLQSRAMKARLMALLDRLRESLSSENARAVTAARDIVASSSIVTYDDYADLMALAREELHACGACFGRPSCSYGRNQSEPGIVEQCACCDRVTALQ